MPIYEYQCERCDTVTDIKHGFKETTSETCPKCGGPLKRLFNAASIVFKGSGFYVNDSRKSPGGETKAKSDASKSDVSKSDASKSDAAKSDAAPKSDSAPPKSGGDGKSDAAA